MRRLVIAAVAVLILAGANYTIAVRERLLVAGAVVVLELAPVDPRSLMQGDYMALRFKVANEAFPRQLDRPAENGRLVIAVGPHGVGSFRRFDDGTPLAAGEIRLRYRIRAGEPKLASNAFFFQEGHARYYEQARFGEFRVSAEGDAILTGLRGKDLEPLGPPRETAPR
jgi:uncharacterized membrane-anchored protein